MAEETLAPASGSALSDLIAAVLIDVARAQHRSNVYSARLGEIYKADPLLRPFPVPNGYVADLVIGLKFAIDSIGADGSRPEPLLARAYKAFDDLVERLTRRVAAALAKALLEDADAFAGDNAQWLATSLADERLLQLLIADAQERVHPVVPDAVTEGGKIRWDVAEPALVAALRAAVVNHPDYRQLAESARQRVYDQISRLTSAAGGADLLHEALAREQPADPVLNGAAGRDVLVSIGADVLGSLQLDVSVRDFLVETAPADPTASGPLPDPVKYRLVRAVQ
jgi:hypothetical protein